MIGGGAWVTAAVKRAMGGYGRVTAICTALLIPFFAAALWVNDWHASLILMFMPMVFCTVFTPASLALAQELGPRGARATVAATLLLMFNIVGLGLGPLFVGMISDALKASQGVESLRFGLALLIVPAALAALAHGQLGRMLDKRTKSGIAHG